MKTILNNLFVFLYETMEIIISYHLNTGLTSK